LKVCKKDYTVLYCTLCYLHECVFIEGLHKGLEAAHTTEDEALESTALGVLGLFEEVPEGSKDCDDERTEADRA
jgi:hypothetical protein